MCYICISSCHRVQNAREYLEDARESCGYALDGRLRGYVLFAQTDEGAAIYTVFSAIKGSHMLGIESGGLMDGSIYVEVPGSQRKKQRKTTRSTETSLPLVHSRRAF